jgi:hypothetical protein
MRCAMAQAGRDGPNVGSTPSPLGAAATVTTTMDLGLRVGTLNVVVLGAASSSTQRGGGRDSDEGAGDESIEVAQVSLSSPGIEMGARVVCTTGPAAGAGSRPEPATAGAGVRLEGQSAAAGPVLPVKCTSVSACLSADGLEVIVTPELFQVLVRAEVRCPRAPGRLPCARQGIPALAADGFGASLSLFPAQHVHPIAIDCVACSPHSSALPDCHVALASWLLPTGHCSASSRP